MKRAFALTALGLCLLFVLAVSPAGTSLAAPPTQDAPPVPAVGQVITATNVYTSPVAQYPAIAELAVGDTVDIYQQTADGAWVNITRLDVLGWAEATFIDCDLVNVPMIATDVMPVATEAATAEPAKTCCKYCRKGKACGDSCIAANRTCSEPPGCACQAQ